MTQYLTVDLPTCRAKLIVDQDAGCRFIELDGLRFTRGGLGEQLKLLGRRLSRNFLDRG